MRPHIIKNFYCFAFWSLNFLLHFSIFFLTSSSNKNSFFSSLLPRNLHMFNSSFGLFFDYLHIGSWTLIFFCFSPFSLIFLLISTIFIIIVLQNKNYISFYISHIYQQLSIFVAYNKYVKRTYHLCRLCTNSELWWQRFTFPIAE